MLMRLVLKLSFPFDLRAVVLEDVSVLHLDCRQNKWKWKRPIFIMTDTYMRLDHYQDDKLFACCHDEAAAWFFRRRRSEGRRDVAC